MSVVFITGTGTDVGKTIATAAIACRLEALGTQVHIVKPVQTGVAAIAEGDLAAVARLSGLPTERFHGIYRYPEPMAPVAAARRANLELPQLERVAEFISNVDGPGRVVLVEGAGGLLVRLGHQWALPELANEFPRHHMLLVTRLGLGSLNEAELTSEVARARGLNLTGLIGGAIAAHPDAIVADNLKELPQLTSLPLLGAVAAGAGNLSPEQFRDGSLQWLGPEFEQWAQRLTHTG